MKHSLITALPSLILIASNASASSQESVRSVTLTSKNLVDVSHEKVDGKIRLTVTFDQGGKRQSAFGEVSIRAKEAYRGESYRSYCAQQENQLPTLTNADYSLCEVVRSFSIISAPSDVSVANLTDYLSGVMNNEYQEIVNGGAYVHNEQTIQGGKASSFNTPQAGSQATTLGKKAVTTSAAQATGSSSAVANANGTQEARNTAINTVQSCVRATPIARMQFSGESIATLSLDWSTRVIPCPRN